MSANPLRFSYYRTKGRVTWGTVALPHRRCYLTTSWASSQSPPSPWPGFSNRIPDNNSSDYGRISSAVLLQLDEQEGHEETCFPASLALLLGYVMRKFPAASRTLAWLFTRLPDENSSGHSRDSSTDLLQMDETVGDMVNCHPSSLAMLLAYIISKFTVAPKPLAQPSIWRFHLFWAAGFVQESS